jgi:hypothetical protein
MAAFDQYLDRKAEDIKAPPLPPAGTYQLMVKKHPSRRDVRSEKGAWESLDFECEIVAPENVDETLLEEFGKVQGYPIRMGFMFSEAGATDPTEARKNEIALNRLKSFLTALQIGYEDGADMTLSEAMALTPSAMFLAELVHTPDKQNADQMYLNINKVHALS